MGVIQSTSRRQSVQPLAPQISYDSLVRSGKTQLSEAQYYRFPSPEGGLPTKVDLREPEQGCYPYPPVREQALLNNCSSLAVTAAYQCLQRLKIKTEPTKVNADLVEPSALYNYYFARKLMGSSRYDSGASVEAAINSMIIGVAEEKMWPYDSDKVNVEPSEAAQLNALQHSLLQYERLWPTLPNLKRCVAAGYPFLFSFAITKGMDKWFRNRNAQLMTQFMVSVDEFTKSDIVGAHTVLVIGYDDQYLQTGAFLCRNSWGPNFGQEGHFWFPYSDVLYPDLSGSFFLLKEICASTTPTCVTKEDCHTAYAPNICQQIP
jgi:C1A family cysteine protease